MSVADMDDTCTPASRLDRAKEVWRGARAVCFDVDSTLTREEGLDKLAEYCGVGEKVAEWTMKAMGGSVTFREALRARLDIVRPTQSQVSAFVASLDIKGLLTPGIPELVSLLHTKGIAVYLVSGGFRRLIEPFAEFLDIPKENIFANRLYFNDDGAYAAFDEDEPTSESGGKPRVVHQLKQRHESVVMIGDGATDMEAHPPADTFIGFGGNVVREKVKTGAPWFVHSIHDLIEELTVPQSSYS